MEGFEANKLAPERLAAAFELSCYAWRCLEGQEISQRQED